MASHIVASRTKIRNISDLKEALAATPKPARPSAPRQACAHEGCNTRQTAEDVERSKSKGGWLCEVHQKDLALYLASLQWKREVLTGEGERRDIEDFAHSVASLQCSNREIPMDKGDRRDSKNPRDMMRKSI